MTYYVKNNNLIEATEDGNACRRRKKKHGGKGKTWWRFKDNIMQARTENVHLTATIFSVLKICRQKQKKGILY